MPPARDSRVALGNDAGPWAGGSAKTVSFTISHDCQLRCRYCFVRKSEGDRMPFEVARRTIDYVLDRPAVFREPAVIWEFGAGEAFLDIDLVREITAYATRRMSERGHAWAQRHCFSISTNGLLYDDPRVQAYIEAYRPHLSVGISIDGTREKHDLQRVFPDGRGSYDAVARNVPLWLSQFPRSQTKATIGREDLPFLKDSVLHLWSLGIKTVQMNVVFEDAWRDGDDRIFEEQLAALGDEILDRGLYREYDCSLFRDTIGQPIDVRRDNGTWCGAGKMLIVDAQGDFYPCHRFLPETLTKRPGLRIGSCFSGLDFNRLRPFLALNRAMQSPPECLSCDVASGCAWCKGLDYDESGTIYHRATHICAMHKARVRANRYFWERFHDRVKDLPAPGSPCP